MVACGLELLIPRRCLQLRRGRSGRLNGLARGLAPKGYGVVLAVNRHDDEFLSISMAVLASLGDSFVLHVVPHSDGVGDANLVSPR